MESEALTAEQGPDLHQLAVLSNEKLQETGNMATQHALNLGCSMSLAPAGVIIILVFLISQANWVAVGIAAALAVMLAVILASLLATVARKRAMQRDYELNIQPEIERQLRDIPGGWETFIHAAQDALPSDAELFKHIGLTPA